MVSRRRFVLCGGAAVAATLLPSQTLFAAPTPPSTHPAVLKIADLVREGIARCVEDNFPPALMLHHHPSGNPHTAIAPWLQKDIEQVITQTLEDIHRMLRVRSGPKKSIWARHDPTMFGIDVQYDIIDRIPVCPIDYRKLFDACVELLPDDLKPQAAAS